MLAKAGHKVTVIDRQPKAGLETSNANASYLSATRCYPWSAPNSPWLLIKSLFQKHKRFKFRLEPNWRYLKWCMAFAYNCLPHKHKKASQIIVSQALNSQQIYKQIIADTGIEFGLQTNGCFVLYYNQQAFDKAKLDEFSVKITRQEVLAKEPALSNGADNLVGAIYSKQDWNGDCKQFTQKLADYCQKNLEVSFLYNTPVTKLVIDNQKIVGFESNQKLNHVENLIICAASYSPQLVEPLGISLPIVPSKGYSITVPIIDINNAPNIPAVNHQYYVTSARLGNKMRFSYMAEFVGLDITHKPSDFEGLIKIAKQMYPTLCDYNNIEYSCGLRPITPDGIPRIEHTKIQGVYLNTAQNAWGWTLAADSAQTLVDVIGQN